MAVDELNIEWAEESWGPGKEARVTLSRAHFEAMRRFYAREGAERMRAAAVAACEAMAAGFGLPGTEPRAYAAEACGEVAEDLAELDIDAVLAEVPR